MSKVKNQRWKVKAMQCSEKKCITTHEVWEYVLQKNRSWKSKVKVIKLTILLPPSMRVNWALNLKQEVCRWLLFPPHTDLAYCEPWRTDKKNSNNKQYLFLLVQKHMLGMGVELCQLNWRVKLILFLSATFKCGFCSKLYTTETITDDADMELFCKMANPWHCVYSVLPPVKSCNHYLRPKGHTYELPRCDSEMNKKSFVPRCLFKYK